MTVVDEMLADTRRACSATDERSGSAPLAAIAVARPCTCDAGAVWVAVADCVCERRPETTRPPTKPATTMKLAKIARRRAMSCSDVRQRRSDVALRAWGRRRRGHRPGDRR